MGNISPPHADGVMATGSGKGPEGRIAAFFDLDKTVIASSSTLAFTRPFYDSGLLSKRAVIKAAAAHLMFTFTAADHNQVEHLRRHVIDMCEGWDAGQIRAIVAETLDEVMAPLVYTGAADLIAEHKAAGHDVVLISASGVEMVEPIGAMLGVDHVAASRMTLTPDGHYAGSLDFYCYGEEKAVEMRRLAQLHGYDLDASFAYSDSVTDVPMLSAVGHPVAVNPDRQLRRIAVDNGWVTVDFERTEPLSGHFGGASSKVAVAVAVGVGAAAVGGVGLHAIRSHRRAG